MRLLPVHLFLLLKISKCILAHDCENSLFVLTRLSLRSNCTRGLLDAARLCWKLNAGSSTTKGKPFVSFSFNRNQNLNYCPLETLLSKLRATYETKISLSLISLITDSFECWRHQEADTICINLLKSLAGRKKACKFGCLLICSQLRLFIRFYKTD